MSEQIAGIVQQWIKDFHNKEFTAAERIDQLVRVIAEREDAAFKQGQDYARAAIEGNFT